MGWLWCDCCGDNVKIVYPCQFVFYDKLRIDINICPDCMDKGKLDFDIPKRRLVAKLLQELGKTEKWKKRGDIIG